jgi:hypothetical protein
VRRRAAILHEWMGAAAAVMTIITVAVSKNGTLVRQGLYIYIFELHLYGIYFVLHRHSTSLSHSYKLKIYIVSPKIAIVCTW